MQFVSSPWVCCAVYSCVTSTAPTAGLPCNSQTPRVPINQTQQVLHQLLFRSRDVGLQPPPPPLWIFELGELNSNLAFYYHVICINTYLYMHIYHKVLSTIDYTINVYFVIKTIRIKNVLLDSDFVVHSG